MKRGIAVPYIIALILGVAVLAMIGYWFFTVYNQGSETACRTRLRTYCAAWSNNGYSPDSGLEGRAFSDSCGDAADTYAPECCSHNWARDVTDTECKSLLGES